MKICSFNVLNLFLNMEKYQEEDLSVISESDWQKISPVPYGDVPKNKSLFELQGLADAILDINADVFVLQEVGGREALKNFNKYFLNNSYQVSLEESNSKRGIYVGFLIKKGFDFTVDSFSRTTFVFEENEIRLSRNLNCLNVSKDGQLLCKVLGVHLKSQMKEGQGKDIDYMDLREAELNHVVGIYRELEMNSPNVPIFIAGDFNCDLLSQGRQEHKAIEGTGLIDIHELKQSSILDKTTFVFFQHMGDTVVNSQLDFILFHKKWEKNIDQVKSGTYYYKNEYGDSLGVPTTRQEKQMMPSDHLPIFLEFTPDKV